MFPFCNARRKGGLKQKDPNRAQPPYPYICPPISAGTLVGDANVPLLCALLRQKLPAYLDLMLPIVRKRRRKRSSKGRRNLNLAPIPPCVNAPLPCAQNIHIADAADLRCSHTIYTRLIDIFQAAAAAAAWRRRADPRCLLFIQVDRDNGKNGSPPGWCLSTTRQTMLHGACL
jgi:hypothetical protein